MAVAKAKSNTTGVAFRELTAEDLKEPTLSQLNALLRDMANAINNQIGLQGKVQFFNDIDLQGHKIINQG